MLIIGVYYQQPYNKNDDDDGDDEWWMTYLNYVTCELMLHLHLLNFCEEKKKLGMKDVWRSEHESIELLEYSMVLPGGTRRSTNFLYKTDYDDLGYKVSENVPKKKSKLTFPPQSEASIGVSKAKKDTIIKALASKMKNTWRLFWLELPENASAKDLLEEVL
nr:unnamed protein product [Callosobruchus analis]